MTKCVMIIILLLAAPLCEAARIIGFKPFSLNSDSQVKATPARSYPLVQETRPAKGFLESKESFGRRADLEEHSGSDTEVLRSSLKFKVVQHEVKKTIPSFEPLGHSPGIGHDNPPGTRH